MSTWLPSLNALRAFEAVARHLSYKRAAEELNVTPAAVKQLVSKLETSVGASLIRREGRRLVLTARGLRAQDDLSRAMRLLDSSVARMREARDENRLLISVEASFATAWLVPRLDEFRDRHPEITVLVDSNQAVTDLNRETIDVAIRYGVQTAPDMISHSLFEDQVFPVCSPALAMGPPKLQRLDQLATIPLIHWDISNMPWATQTRRWFTWESWLAQVRGPEINPRKGLFFNEYGQAVQAAIAGQGMLLASWPILRKTVEAGLLVAPFQERVTTDIGYEVVATPEAARRPAVAAFIDWLLDRAKREERLERVAGIEPAP